MAKRKEVRRIIWNAEINLDDWKEFLEQEYPEVVDEAEQYELCAELNTEYLDDERMNLNKRLSSEIVCIGDLGLWNGRRQGYRIVGNNIQEILYSTLRSISYCTWYADAYNVKCDEVHHDGCNHYLYRAFKSGLSDTQKENFLDKLYYGKCTSSDISRYTESILPYVAEVYGWQYTKRTSKKRKAA